MCFQRSAAISLKTLRLCASARDIFTRTCVRKNRKCSNLSPSHLLLSNCFPSPYFAVPGEGSPPVLLRTDWRSLFGPLQRKYFQIMGQVFLQQKIVDDKGGGRRKTYALNRHRLIADRATNHKNQNHEPTQNTPPCSLYAAGHDWIDAFGVGTKHQR